MAAQNADAVAITGGTITGVTITGHASLDLASANNLSDVANAATSRTNLAIAPHVATLAALQSSTTATYPSGVWRDDYSAGLGAPPLWYEPSGSACSLAAGAGDNGSQVQSSNGKCWLAVFPTAGRDVREWGAVGNCTVDDTVPIQAAISASTDQTVLINSCYRITSGFSITAPVQIVGNNPMPYAGWPGLGAAATCATGIRVDTANLAAAFAMSAAASGTEIRGLCIDNRSLNNTSGATITAISTSGTALNNIRLSDNQIIGCFICVDISGTGAVTQNVGGVLAEKRVFSE